MVVDTDALPVRVQQFQAWVETVRDPAEQSTEGLRILQTKNEGAVAEYEVAAISHHQWAIRLSLAYRCGDCRGMGVPWTAFSSREECIAFFLLLARRHFQVPQRPFESEVQQAAQREMIGLLREGLFGFSEPALSVRV